MVEKSGLERRSQSGQHANGSISAADAYESPPPMTNNGPLFSADQKFSELDKVPPKDDSITIAPVFLSPDGQLDLWQTVPAGKLHGNSNLEELSTSTKVRTASDTSDPVLIHNKPNGYHTILDAKGRLEAVVNDYNQVIRIFKDYNKDGLPERIIFADKSELGTKDGGKTYYRRCGVMPELKGGEYKHLKVDADGNVSFDSKEHLFKPKGIGGGKVVMHVDGYTSVELDSRKQWMDIAKGLHIKRGENSFQVLNKDGDVLRRATGAADGTFTVTDPDGTRWSREKDGTDHIRRYDGSQPFEPIETTVYSSDGSINYFLPSDNRVTDLPDGRLLVMPSGSHMNTPGVPYSDFGADRLFPRARMNALDSLKPEAKRLADLLKEHKTEDFSRELRGDMNDRMHEEVLALLKFIDELNDRHRSKDKTIPDVVLNGYEGECGWGRHDWITSVQLRTPRFWPIQNGEMPFSWSKFKTVLNFNRPADAYPYRGYATLDPERLQISAICEDWTRMISW